MCSPGSINVLGRWLLKGRGLQVEAGKHERASAAASLSGHFHSVLFQESSHMPHRKYDAGGQRQCKSAKMKSPKCEIRTSRFGSWIHSCDHKIDHARNLLIRYHILSSGRV